MKLFKSNLVFMKEVYSQAFKQIKEYPINFFSVVYFDISLTGVYLFFYSIIQSLSVNFLNWTYLDFILLYVTIQMVNKATYFFILRGLNKQLLSGELNVWKCKPISPFIGMSSRAKDGAIFTTLLFIPFFIVLYIYGSYQNLLLGILLLLFGLVYYTIYSDFFESIAFFIKQNNFIIRISKDVAYLNDRFTPKVFEGSRLNFLFYLPTALFGFYFIEVVNNRFDYLIQHISGILISFLLFVIGTYIMWYYGLKKYEAFG